MSMCACVCVCVRTWRGSCVSYMEVFMCVGTWRGSCVWYMEVFNVCGYMEVFICVGTWRCTCVWVHGGVHAYLCMAVHLLVAHMQGPVGVLGVQGAAGPVVSDRHTHTHTHTLTLTPQPLISVMLTLARVYLAQEVLLAHEGTLEHL